MKIRIFLGILIFFITVCDRQLVGPVRDNPFDAESSLTFENPFNLQTQNLSGHILVSWEYTYEKPVIERFLLYRINESGLDTLYTGLTTTFEDSDVDWDSTYSYYVTGIINEKETPHPEISDLPEVVRRIVVGENGDYTSIGDAINSLNDGDVAYITSGTYNEIIDFSGKKLELKCSGEVGSCIIDGEGSGPVITFSGNEDTTTVLDGFTIQNGSSGDEFDGGGMTIKSNPLIKNCTFHNNTADRGGAVFIRQGAAPIFTECNFTNNSSTSSESEHGGGAIYSYERSDPVFNNCNFNDNNTLGNGGASYSGQDAKPVYNNCTFSGNNAQEHGGAIYEIQSKPAIYNCIFSSNLANAGDGGAIYLSSTPGPLINLCNFSFNKSSQGDGGAIYLNNNGLVISNCYFNSNEAVNGGAGYIYNSIDLKFRQCQFVENSSDFGGGLYIKEAGNTNYPITLQNCIFWKQVAYNGGAINNEKSNLSIIHSTIVENRAEGQSSSQGGGIYSYMMSQNISIQNSIIFGNIAENKSQISIYNGTITSISFSDIENIVSLPENIGNNLEVEYNIDDDPLFINSNEGDFHLQEGSPCIGTGQAGVNMGAYGGAYGDW